MVDAVIFDLDGVLIDSEPIWEQVRREYVAVRGGRWLPDSQRRMMGMNTAEWTGYLSGELGVDRTPEQVAEDVIGAMVRRYEQHLPVIDDAPAVVRRLAERYPLGLASSSPRRLIAAALAGAGLAGVFRVTLSTEQVPRGKPAPDVYRAVAERLGVDPARCVAVEDSTNGVRAAVSAGMRVVAVPREEYPLDPDAARSATLTLSAIGELTERAVRELP